MLNSTAAIVDQPDRVDAAELADFLRHAGDQLLGYHHLDYQIGMTAILGDRFRQLILRDEAGKIAGYMPFRERAGPAGNLVNALPFFGPNGLLAARDDHWRDRLLMAFRESMARPEVLVAVIYTPFLLPPEPIARVFRPDFRVPKETQYLDLTGPMFWPKARRGDIRKAQHAGFTVRRSQSSDVHMLYQIYLQNCADAGIPTKPLSYFELTMGLAENKPDHPTSPLWLTAELEGKIVAGLLTMRGPRVASYTIPIAAADVRSLQPTALLIDIAIEQCRAAGLVRWNFESSPARGDPVFKFKERWGSQSSAYEIQGYYPNGADLVQAISPTDLARSYPGYFAYPFRHMIEEKRLQNEHR
ncbi:GNAT family N-acetyltransferase [Dongia sp.]|uniref:GNAT family N-acetyltransferase n=1 Tax=Dongia sp. TaxID=1977262 RepID=UPI0035B4A0F2